MCAYGVLTLLCVLDGFARLAVLVYFVYVDGFFCSTFVHSVCFVYCVFCFVLPVLPICCILYILMVSSALSVCIRCGWFSVYFVLFCPSC